MIHKPSLVHCRPFGLGMGDGKAISTFPTERVFTSRIELLARGAASRAGTRAATGAAAPSARKFLRPIIASSLTKHWGPGIQLVFVICWPTAFLRSSRLSRNSPPCYSGWCHTTYALASLGSIRGRRSHSAGTDIRSPYPSSDRDVQDCPDGGSHTICSPRNRCPAHRESDRGRAAETP